MGSSDNGGNFLARIRLDLSLGVLGVFRRDQDPETCLGLTRPLPRMTGRILSVGVGLDLLNPIQDWSISNPRTVPPTRTIRDSTSIASVFDASSYRNVHVAVDCAFVTDYLAARCPPDTVGACNFLVALRTREDYFVQPRPLMWQYVEVF